jgi:hypothetical protein
MLGHGDGREAGVTRDVTYLDGVVYLLVQGPCSVGEKRPQIEAEIHDAPSFERFHTRRLVGRSQPISATGVSQQIFPCLTVAQGVNSIAPPLEGAAMLR